MNARPRRFGLPFLAADVGGTHARVAIASMDASGTIALSEYSEYRCADFAGLDALLQAFTAVHHSDALPACIIACSGQRVGNDIINPTLPWHVNLDVLHGLSTLGSVHVLNDFEALGYALDSMRDGRLLLGPAACPPGNALIIGPGTGLGVAFCMAVEGESGVVVPSEAGQMAFAPGTAREWAILQVLAGEHGYASCEDVVSGPGLLRVYRALCSLDGQTPTLTAPETVTVAARAGDPIAQETVNIFFAALGSIAGDLAMAFSCTGGVYLAGGILAEVADLLERSDFGARFLAKGVMRKFLTRVPVRLAMHGSLGVIGAARWYVERATPPDTRSAVAGRGQAKLNG